MWQAANCWALFSWGCLQQELPEHTAAQHRVTSCLALSFCFCLQTVMAQAHFSQAGGWVCLTVRGFTLLDTCDLGSMVQEKFLWSDLRSWISFAWFWG